MKKASLFLAMSLLLADLCLAGVSVVGDLSRKDSVGPGERYEGVITVKNTADSPAEVRIYQADYLFHADGSNVYGPPGTAPRSNAGWITASPAQLTVPPKGTGSFHYAVQVPGNKNLHGTYWSLLMVEPLAVSSPVTAVAGKSGEVGLKTVIRYAVQVMTDIGDSGERKIAFLDRKLTAEEGRKTFQVDIGNSGERWLSPVVWMDLYSSHGSFAGRFESGRKGVYPGCSVRHLFDLSAVAAGKYTALVIVDNRDDHVFGGQYEIVLR